jgi:hypothetical protein
MIGTTNAAGGNGNVTADMLGIVIKGNSTPVGASKGQYTIVKNSTINGITDGLYTAAQAIPANTAIDSTYLTAVTNGGLNDTVKYMSSRVTSNIPTNVWDVTNNVCGRIAMVTYIFRPTSKIISGTKIFTLPYHSRRHIYIDFFDASDHIAISATLNTNGDVNLTADMTANHYFEGSFCYII